MLELDLETKIVLNFKTEVIPKERSIYWYLDNINYNFEVDLSNWWYCEDKKIKDTLQLELIMNLIKAWINFKEEIKGLCWIFDCEKKVIYIGSEMNWGE